MTIFASRFRSFFSGIKFAGTLQTYFRSGWAFLIPYLAAYLVYAWLKWPVNPASGGKGIVNGISESGSLASSFQSLVPSLLHVYWALHTIHAILAGCALCAWWRSRFSNQETNSAFSSQLSNFWPLLPWACLALVFWIPGIYLEWPSDPWEHLRRINEWHLLDQVTAHSFWKKSSYFLPYSLTGHLTSYAQLTWLNFYYTGVSLLLCWQYYRLARAAELGRGGAFLFTLLTAVTMGNSIFSFYRYYGLSSSLLAQIGVVALLRIALEFHIQSRKGIVATTMVGFALITLIALNHAQGFGIAGLGVLAIAVRQLIEWRRAMVGWLTLAAVLLSVLVVLYFPRHPALDEICIPAKWLTGWYGFDLFSPSSPAQERAMHVLGVTGILSFGASLWLILRKNHVAGWLTVMPILALATPCTALPLAHVLASGPTAANIVTFHRFFFAIPSGLAIVVVISLFLSTQDIVPSGPPADRSKGFGLSRTITGPRFLTCLLPLSLLMAVGVAPDGPSFNRTWQSLAVVGDDLTLREYIGAQPHVDIRSPAGGALRVNDALADAATSAFSPRKQEAFYRAINAPPQAAMERTLSWFARHYPPRSLTVLAPAQRASRTTPLSGDAAIPVVIEAAFHPHERLAIDFTAATAGWFSPSGTNFSLTARGERLEIANHPGNAGDLFASTLFRFDPDNIYRVVYELSQVAGPPSTSYLAVSWHDESGRHLESWRESPLGAGDPAGWENGTYSYFGLTGRQQTPAKWSRFEAWFGFGQAMHLPGSATHLRVGALLNYNQIPEAVTVLRRVQLWERQGYPAFVFTPSPLPSSLMSQAGFLSRHWPAQKVALDQLGEPERRAAIKSVTNHTADN